MGVVLLIGWGKLKRIKLVFLKKSVGLFICLDEYTEIRMCDLVRKSGYTQSGAKRLVDSIIDRDLVFSSRISWNRSLGLTPKGAVVKDRLLKLKKVLDEN